jgi:hypothetical protein
MALTRRSAVARLASGAFAALLVALACAGCGASGSGTTSSQSNAAQLLVPREQSAVAKAEASLALDLPTKPGQPAPSLPTDGFVRPLPAHQVVGFLPYWEVGTFTPDYAALTTLVYWSLTLGAGGSIAHGGQGFSTLRGASLAVDVSEAHAARDRVLLTVFSESARVIDSVSNHPLSSGRQLADKIAPLLSSGGFDGVDLDIEGESSADRNGFVSFVASFSKTLRSLGPSWSIMLDTYATSAFEPAGFFDVKALMDHVDELFVMAYDMQTPGIASATAPLANADLNDAMTLAEYASVVPASRIVLGIPLYGYDFPASSRYDGAAATGNPVAVTYSEIVAAGHKAVWDPTTETPLTVFRRKGKWHQTWFDDPVSIALKSALATRFGCAGVGVWELGMAGNNASVEAALLGGSQPVKLSLATERL